MSARTPMVVWGAALALCMVNLLIVVSTLKIHFFPSRLAWQWGLAFGVACAGYQWFAGLFTRAHLEEISETARDRIRGSLSTRSVLVLTLTQFLLGIFGFAHGISGLYVWTAGEKTVVSYEVTRVHWNSSRYKRCYQHDLEGFGTYSNSAFAPCLAAELKAGTTLAFRGRKSSLGLKYDDFSATPSE